MKVLSRYIGREALLTTLGFAAALVMLSALFDLIRELGSLGKGTYQFARVVLFIGLLLPSHLYEVFPIAVLIGTLFALAQMVASSEYTVMRTAGVSVPQVGWALARVGVVLAAITFAIGEYVVPYTEQIAQRLKLQSLDRVVAQQFRSGVWMRQDQSFVNIREVLPDTRLRGVRIFEFDRELKLRSVSEAQSGEYAGSNRWKLSQVTRTRLEGGRAVVETLPELVWQSVLDPSFLNVLLVQPERMSASNLYHYIGYLADNRQRTARYEIAFWTKVAYPLAVLVMMALALPFSQFQRRAGGVGGRIFLGIMLGLLFYLCNQLSSFLGLLYDWPPMAAAMTPTLLFLAWAVWLQWRLERR